MKTKIILLFASVLCNLLVLSQSQFEFYYGDSWTPFFKELNKENGFYFRAENLKDSLSDGEYRFYTCKKISIKSRPYSIISGVFLDGKKEGLFRTITYAKEKDGLIVSSIESCNYENGVRSGTYSMVCFQKGIVVSLMAEDYKDGLLEGTCIYWQNGIVEYMHQYSKGVRLQNNHFSLD